MKPSTATGAPKDDIIFDFDWGVEGEDDEETDNDFDFDWGVEGEDDEESKVS